MPLGKLSKGIGHCRHHLVRHHNITLQVDRPDLEKALSAVRFGIHAPDQGISVQDREAEIAVHALCERRISLDEIVEPE